MAKNAEGEYHGSVQVSKIRIINYVLYISCVLCLCLRIRLNNYCVTFLGEECCHGDVTCVRIMPSIIMGTMHPCCVKINTVHSCNSYTAKTHNL